MFLKFCFVNACNTLNLSELLYWYHPKSQLLSSYTLETIHIVTKSLTTTSYCTCWSCCCHKKLLDVTDWLSFLLSILYQVWSCLPYVREETTKANCDTILTREQLLITTAITVFVEITTLHFKLYYRGVWVSVMLVISDADGSAWRTKTKP